MALVGGELAHDGHALGRELEARGAHAGEHFFDAPGVAAGVVGLRLHCELQLSKNLSKVQFIFY
jgi:hypothetical protein